MKKGQRNDKTVRKQQMAIDISNNYLDGNGLNSPIRRHRMTLSSVGRCTAVFLFLSKERYVCTYYTSVYKFTEKFQKDAQSLLGGTEEC